MTGRDQTCQEQLPVLYLYPSGVVGYSRFEEASRNAFLAVFVPFLYFSVVFPVTRPPVNVRLGALCLFSLFVPLILK